MVITCDLKFENLWLRFKIIVTYFVFYIGLNTPIFLVKTMFLPLYSYFYVTGRKNYYMIKNPTILNKLFFNLWPGGTQWLFRVISILSIPMNYPIFNIRNWQFPLNNLFWKLRNYTLTFLVTLPFENCMVQINLNPTLRGLELPRSSQTFTQN